MSTVIPSVISNNTMLLNTQAVPSFNNQPMDIRQQQAQHVFRQKQLSAQRQHMLQQQQQQQGFSPMTPQQQQQQHHHHLMQQQQLLQQKMHQQHLIQQQQHLMQQQRNGVAVTNILPSQELQQQDVISPAPSKILPMSSGRHPASTTSGQAVVRLLQFAEQLSPGHEKAVDRMYWDNFIDNFFTHSSTMKIGLFNTETQEQKAYEMNQALQARFFHTQYMCGIKSIQMTLEKTMEYILPGGDMMNVECPRASLIHKFENGLMVILTGHLWVQFSFTGQEWKIGHLDFNFYQAHEEYIHRLACGSGSGGGGKKTTTTTTTKKIPESLVNQWGVPPRVFHVLQIANVFTPKMSEIVFHSLVSGATPRESLQAIALDKQSRMINSTPHYIDSPIVKTQQQQNGQQQQRTLQQQAALRSQLSNNNNFAGLQTPLLQQQQQQYPPSSSSPTMATRKRKNSASSSTTTGKASPVTRKKNASIPRK